MKSVKTMLKIGLGLLNYKHKYTYMHARNNIDAHEGVYIHACSSIQHNNTLRHTTCPYLIKMLQSQSEKSIEY